MTGLGRGFALADYQLHAVERLEIILDRRGGAILADDPGLGKSFVAAELARRARRQGVAVEVVVPASLIAQWEETLQEFDVQAPLLSHDRIITDPFVPQPVPRLLIVDEAHGFRNPRTQRYDALARRCVGARVLLVTATPLCNALADLEALIGLIVADDALADRGVSSMEVAFTSRDRDAVGIVVAELLVRRDRTLLPEALQFGDLVRKVIRCPPFDPGGEIERLIAALRFPLIDENILLRHFLWRRLESSEEALLESIRRQRRFYERALECLASGRALPKRDYRRAFGGEEDRDSFQTVLFWELFVPEAGAGSVAEVEAEIERLEALRRAVDGSPRHKREKLIDLCKKSDEPMLIFTGWAATAADLYAAVRTVRRAALVTGRRRHRAGEAIAAFRSGAADVLVSTDLGAEGLNLQRAAVVVHYDIPWNPVKLDQRNGRAHRIGQTSDVVKAIYFLSHDDRAGVLHKVAAKNRTRRRFLSSGPDLEGRRTLTLRPRVTREAAIVAFRNALGRPVPPLWERRHRVGVERLLAALSRELIDERKLADLEALLALERWVL